MREIKFRAWDKLGKRMMEAGVVILDGYDHPYGAHIIDMDKCSHFMSDIELMQYVGLKDKHDWEIYEGDILTHESYPFQDEGNYNYHAVVRWLDDSAQFGYEMWLANKDRRGISHGICEGFESENGRVEFEIIGNIYENPELIERWGKYQGDCY